MAVDTTNSESSEDVAPKDDSNDQQVSGRSDNENEGTGGDDSSDKGEEDEEVYEVEAILKERTRKGVKEYFVRWKGYDENWDTWEPEENLNCDDIIEEFKKQKEKKKVTPGRKRKSSEEKPAPVKKATTVEKKPRGRPKRTKVESSSDDEDDDEPATVVRCKTRFKKFVIEYAIEAEDDRSSDDDTSEDPMKKYFLKFDMETGEFSISDVKVDVNEESKTFTCLSCQKSGPPWGRTPRETTPSWAKHLAISMKCHVIGQHLGGYSCRLCEKNELTFQSRTLRSFQKHMNEIHRRRLDMDPYDEEEEETAETTEKQSAEVQSSETVENGS